MAEEKEKVNAFYSMGKGASYTDRTSGLNSLADAMNLQMQNYSEQMALAAAQRRAARQDKRAAKEEEKLKSGFYEDKYAKDMERKKKQEEKEAEKIKRKTLKNDK